MTAMVGFLTSDKMKFNHNLQFWPLNGWHKMKSPFLTMTAYIQGCLPAMNWLTNYPTLYLVSYLQNDPDNSAPDLPDCWDP